MPDNVYRLSDFVLRQHNEYSTGRLFSSLLSINNPWQQTRTMEIHLASLIEDEVNKMKILDVSRLDRADQSAYLSQSNDQLK